MALTSQMLDQFSGLYSALTPDAQTLIPRGSEGGFMASDIESLMANPNDYFAQLENFSGPIFGSDAGDLFDINGNQFGSISGGQFVPFNPTSAPASGTTVDPVVNPDPTPQLPPPAGGITASTGSTDPFVGLLNNFWMQDASQLPFMDFDQSGVIDFPDFLAYADRLNSGGQLFLGADDFAGTGGAGGPDNPLNGLDLNGLIQLGFDPRMLNLSGNIGLGFDPTQLDLGGNIGLGFDPSQLDLSGNIGLGFNPDQLNLGGLINLGFDPTQLDLGGRIGLGFDPSQLNLNGNIGLGFDPSSLILPDIGIDTTGVNLPDIGISREALLGLGQFADALNAFGNFNLDNAVQARLNPFITGLGTTLEQLQGLIDQQSQVVPDDNIFSDAPDFSDPTNQTTQQYTDLDLPTITDDRQFLTDAFLNQVLGNTGAQDLVGSELATRLGAANPFAKLSEGEDSVLNRVIDRINSQSEKGRDRLLNQYAVTNKLDQPIFKEQLQDYETGVENRISDAIINFGLQEAGAEEGIRRGRIQDLLGFNQGVTGNLSNALQQATQNFVTDVNLQSSAQNQALQDFINTVSFNNAVGSSQAGFSDQGLGMALNFLGLSSPNSTGASAANIFGNIVSQQNQANAGGGGGNMLSALLSNPSLFSRG